MARSLADRVEALERNALRHDKQIEAIRNLIHENMRLVIQSRKEGLAVRKELRQLASNVKELTNSLERGANGHGKTKLHIQ